MTKQHKLIKQRLSENRPGLILFGILVLLTIAALAAPPNVLSFPTIGKGKTGGLPNFVKNHSGQVTISGKLSQTKVVQNSDGLLYLDLSIETPAAVLEQASIPATDLIIVLDSSGSMGAANKMPFAKAAITRLLSQMDEQDRIGLVAFSNSAQVLSPLVPVDSANHQRLIQTLQSISPNGGTNLGEGLLKAMGLVDTEANRVRKILLLSDGEANQGITNPQQLAGLSAQFKHHESILSTIGMGLGFNETLMSSLADHGMGNYSYLEDLSGLNTILAKDLMNSRKVFANASELLIELGDGVQLTDAGGYPITQSNNESSSVTVSTGQLLASETKRLILTLLAPTANVAETIPAQVSLVYRYQGHQQRAMLNADSLKLTVVAPEKRDEAIASVDKKVYQSSWIKNNLGRLKKKLSRSLKAGNKQEAEAVISAYRDSVSSAQAKSKVDLLSQDLDDELDELNSSVAAAFAGRPAEQKEKQNRAAKRLLSESINEQRINVKP